jgi:hydrogenase maturation protease
MERPAIVSSDSHDQECTSGAAHAILVAGIGSSHGDDQLGWLVAQDLIQRSINHCQVRIALTPLHVLDWMDECSVLHVVDACKGLGQPRSIRRWNWPCLEIQQTVWTGTHDFDLPGVLTLAERLGQLPQQVVVWGVQCADQAADSATIVRWIQSVANRIQSEVDRHHSLSQNSQI